MDKKPKVLFLCTGNPARGAMAEGFLRKMAGDAVICASASVTDEPMDSCAVQVMCEDDIDISKQHTKTTSEALRETFAAVVTIFDKSIERSPVFPFTLRILRWNVEDPTRTTSSNADKLTCYRRTRDTIERCVRDFLTDKPTQQQSTAFRP